MWVSRDKGSDRVELWDKEPHIVGDGCWYGENDIFDGHVCVLDGDLAPFVQPCQCVEIEDIKLVRKAKPIKVKHNFKFSEPGAKLEGGGIKGKRGVETVKRKRELPNKWWAVCIGGDSWNVNQSKRFATAIFKIAIKRGLTAEIFPVSVCRCGPTRQPRRRAK